MSVLTTGTDIKIACADPIFVMTAFFTGKAIEPLLFKQVLVASFRI